MKTLFTLICLAITLTFTAPAFAEGSIVGYWKTIDDKTKQPKSVVQIYQQKGKYYGKVVKLLEGATATHAKAPEGDQRNGKLIVGMIVLKGLVRDAGEFKGGTILDPKDGKIYRCKAWKAADGTLRLRGYIGIFFRTQTWHQWNSTQ